MNDFTQALTTVFASVIALFQSFIAPGPVVAPTAEAYSHATVLFGGDMMFDRTIRTVGSAKGEDFLFSCLDSLLLQEEVVVANLEGPITEKASVSVGTVPGVLDNMTFTFPTSTGALLYRHNIRLVNVGNNHSRDFGMNGASSTLVALAGAQVEYFGDVIESAVVEKTAGEVPLSFVTYNEFAGDATTTIEQIAEARAKGRFPIVYTHWGIEYATTTPEYIRSLAHRFVDAGAEIVIGSHPHVVGEREFYLPSGSLEQAGNEKYIYYSLGNFIFDQYWDDAVSHGLLVRVAFDREGVVYVEELPIRLGTDGRTCIKEVATSSPQIAG